MRYLALLALLAACGDSGGSVAPPAPPPPAPPPPLADPYVVGLVTHELTPASRLYHAPWWALYIVVVGADAEHSGIAFQGTLGRLDMDPATRGRRCLGPASQLPGERSLAYTALGDTLYSPDSTAYWALVNRLSQGADSLRAVLDSAAAGAFRARLPGLVVLTTGVFDPTVSVFGRGATRATAILRHWAWRDTGHVFAEDTASALLAACNLRP